MLARGRFHQRNVSKRAVLREQTNIAKALAAQQLSVGVMLDINRQGFGDRGDRRLVPVILMSVSDDNGIHVNDRFDGKRQFHQRVTQLAARGTGKARPGALG